VGVLSKPHRRNDTTWQSQMVRRKCIARASKNHAESTNSISTGVDLQEAAGGVVPAPVARSTKILKY